jgi:putative SOS response-associated peptidase YedK
MPVIVGKDAADAWLNRETPATVIQEIMTNDISDLTAYPVSHYVNSPANDDDRCWLPSGT